MRTMSPIDHPSLPANRFARILALAVVSALMLATSSLSTVSAQDRLT